MADSWTKKADFGGTKREQACGFSIGNKGYFGIGIDTAADKNDFWEYDATFDTWSQKANFPGPPRGGGVAFAISGKGYLGTGYDGTVFQADWYEYDAGNNTWTKKADFPGSGGRQGAVAFVIGNKGYVGTGYCTANGNNADFWEYNPVGDVWTQKAAYIGSARNSCAGFSIGTKGYVACGYNGVYRKDVYEYDSQGNTWTQVADIGGSGRTTPLGFTLLGYGYVSLGFDLTTGFKTDIWRYNQSNNTWTAGTAVYPGLGCGHAAVFVIGNRAFAGTGHENVYFRDFYMYTPDSLTTSVIEPALSELSLFPNPFKEFLRIDQDRSDALLYIYDVNGNAVLTREIKIGSEEIDTQALSAGIYFYRLIADEKTFTGKIIKSQ